MKKYWLVHPENGELPYKSYRHRLDAEADAARQAKKNPNIKFVILEPTAYIVCELSEPMKYLILERKGENNGAR